MNYWWLMQNNIHEIHVGNEKTHGTLVECSLEKLVHKWRRLLGDVWELKESERHNKRLKVQWSSFFKTLLAINGIFLWTTKDENAFYPMKNTGGSEATWKNTSEPFIIVNSGLKLKGKINGKNWISQCHWFFLSLNVFFFLFGRESKKSVFLQLNN